MKEFITEYINKKILENEEYIRITFYELRVKCNLTEEQTDEFLRLAKIRLENMNYKVFFTNAKFTYKNANITVQPNELMIAIKEEQ